MWGTLVRSCLVNLKITGLQFCQAGPPNMNSFKGFAKTISFLFHIYEIFVQLFFRNTLLQILLIESIFFKKIGLIIFLVMGSHFDKNHPLNVTYDYSNTRKHT